MGYDRYTKRLGILFLLSVLGLLIYSNTFSVPFILDDSDNIVQNPMLRDLASSLRFTGTRSVGFLTFALNYHFGGLNVFGYHLVNVLIHIVNGFLVYFLIRLLLRTVRPSLDAAPWIALAAALLFVVHPVQTQAVTYIVQRFASLMTLFYLLSVVAYLKWRLSPPEGSRRYVWYAVSLVSCVLAMKTKENSFTLPLIILLIEGVFFKITKKSALSLIPFLLTLFIIPFSSGQIDQIGQIWGEAEGFAQDTDEIGRLSYLFTQFRVIVTYLRLLVLPIHQNLDYDFPVFHSLGTPPVLLSFLFLLSLFGLGVYLLIGARVAPSTGKAGWSLPLNAASRLVKRQLIGFGIVWFFLTLAVESSIIPIKDVIFEHRVYLPSVGFLMAVSVGWLWSEGRPAAWRTAVIVLALLILGGAAYRRNGVWADPVALWQDVVKKAPNKARAHGNLGSALEAKGRLDDAVREFQTALRLQPDYPQAHNNLGSAWVTKGRLDEAVREYEAALKLRPDMAEGHYGLGLVRSKQGRSDEAIREYEAALKLKPDYLKARNNLATLHAMQGRLPEAARDYETVLKLNPDYAEAHNNLGNVYMLQGRFPEAVERYRSALRLRPHFEEARKNLEKARAHSVSQ